MDLQTIFLVFGGGALALVFAWLAWLTVRFLDESRAAFQDRAAIKEEFAEYKQSVTERFASVAHLKDVEGRLIKVMSELGDKLDRLTDAFQKHLVTVAEAVPRRRSDK